MEEFRTEEITRQKVVEETKEIHEYKCVNCNQWYEQTENIGEVSIDETPHGNLCGGCVRAIFGVDTDLSVVEAGRRNMAELEGRSLMKAAMKESLWFVGKYVLLLLFVVGFTLLAMPVVETMPVVAGEPPEVSAGALKRPLYIAIMLVWAVAVAITTKQANSP